ncbi:MAG: hypothetical protein LBU56_01010 [Rickettsiales bacterium]|jgi:hypothetical protein|nr:hypothetical protein [Rickettsiales bacterium]
MNEHLFLQQMLSFQRVTLESRNFIRLVSIEVMLKCTIFMGNWIPASSTGMTGERATWMTGEVGAGLLITGPLALNTSKTKRLNISIE